MSLEEVEKQIKTIQDTINVKQSIIFSNLSKQTEITPFFLNKVSILLESYGQFVGNAKAKHYTYLDDINNIDGIARGYFEDLMTSHNAKTCFKLVSLGVGKISELLQFVKGIELSKPAESIPKAKYEKLVKEDEINKGIIETLIKYKGLPELNELLESARDVKLPVDEHWVLALCSANLIEAVVNKKLDGLEKPTQGNFEKRYKRLAQIIEEKEQRDISQLLPLAIYSGIRHKLDHASHSNRVTPKEAKDISRIVVNLIVELFSSQK